MTDPLHSHWTVPQVLAALPGVCRVDDGGDVLAFRVAGVSPTRKAYIFLYGEDPDVISFDLEDEAADSTEWDHTVRRGQTKSLTQLREELLAWLNASCD